ncbi:preprotein translocase subunit SecG [Rhizobium halophytocola]|uniref:Protein-export membrane protein SecG n=1 Tax=Rhizobium halophytocola TaxID=735519 RepID=A0ABS4DWC1_9HYPH|nr:preprotein translocase subunit SecG [Rhizobium halophytocola]MBP1849993.1 preprotein translocase subunit SecG [Rhizobium halophytocola]
MQTVLIVIHLMIVLALVGVVLIQRSEGGGLGIGGGSGFMSARGTANALTRTTGILAALFFVTSMALTILARYEAKPTDILDRINQTEQQSEGSSVLDQLPGAAPATNGTAPAANGAAPATDGAATPAKPAAPAQDPNAVPTGN